MFRFIIRFLKVLAIACIIGVGLRVIDVVFYKEKEDKTDKQIASEIITANSSEESNSQPIENIVIIKEQKEEKQEEKTEIKENKEAGTVVVKPKETVKQETKQETTNTQTEISSYYRIRCILILNAALVGGEKQCLETHLEECFV